MRDHATKRENCGGDDGGDEKSRRLGSARRCIGARLRLRFAYQFYDFALAWFRPPTRFGAHHKAAAGVERAAGELVASGFFYWHGLAGDHGFVLRRWRLRAERRRLETRSPWPNAKAIAFFVRDPSAMSCSVSPLPSRVRPVCGREFSAAREWRKMFLHAREVSSTWAEQHQA